MYNVHGCQNVVSISNEVNKFVYKNAASINIIGHWAQKYRDVCELEFDAEKHLFGELKLTGIALKQQLCRIQLLGYWICSDARCLHDMYRILHQYINAGNVYIVYILCVPK